MLELGIGVFGVDRAVGGAGARRRLHRDRRAPGPVSLVLRAVVAGICLIPPTLLMGATLPAIARWVETTPRGVSWLGYFYGGNLAGAVVGSLLAGFYLLRVYDMPTATFVAVALNVRRGAAGAGDRAAHAAHGDRARRREAPPAVAASRPETRLVYVAIALSGLTALGAEVVWTRLLSLLFGATAYTFSLILAVFLVGLGIGSSLGVGAGARRAPTRASALGWCQVGAVRGAGLGRVRHRRVAAVLADQSVDLHAARRSTSSSI